MKRNGFILTCLFLIIPFLGMSQNENILVTYDIYFNMGVTSKKSGILVSNGSSSLFRQGSNFNKEDDIPRDEFGDFYIDTQKNNLDIHVIKDSLFTMTYVDNDLYRVHEKLPNIKWNLNKKEEKIINGYTSYKATGKFRGREYTAWYTPEIPINIGPWKFNGLPGLILEISDSNKKFQWFVKEINYPYKGSITSLESHQDDFSKVSLKEYVEIFEEYKKKLQSRMAARAPKGVKLTSSKSSRGIELIYDWEE